ncbi:hypothetical protein Tco_0053224 [Tanacetum coccineum]
MSRRGKRGPSLGKKNYPADSFYVEFDEIGAATLEIPLVDSIHGFLNSIENGERKHEGSALSRYGMQRKQKTKDYSKIAGNVSADTNVVLSETIINDGLSIANLFDSIENARANAYPRGNLYETLEQMWFRIEVDLRDDSAHTFVVMLDEMAKELTKSSTKALLDGLDEAADDVI